MDHAAPAPADVRLGSRLGSSAALAQREGWDLILDQIV